MERPLRLAVDLANEALVILATAESRMVELARRVLAWGKPVLTLAGEENRALLDIGAEPVTPKRWVRAR